MKNILLIILFTGLGLSAFAQFCPPEDNNNGNRNKPPGPNGGNPFHTEVITDNDPNEIIGPAGVGSRRWVSVHDRLPYTILFENDTVATAAAKVVKVFYVIDPNHD